MSDSFEDALREALEKIPPADLVGRDGITKETVLMMNAMAGKTVEVTDQKLRADDDGAVGIQRTTGTATMFGWSA